VTGRLRVGAWLVCLGLLGAGLYLALLAPGKAAFVRVDGRLHDITVETVNTPAGPDRLHRLTLTGAACADYDYLESWARGVGLPVITDLNANEPMTIYADARSCAGFNGGGSAGVRALVYQGKLYMTAAYQHPPNDRLANLPAALLLLLIGAAGVFLLLRRRLRTGGRGHAKLTG
jgi:hypothetical protein